MNPLPAHAKWLARKRDVAAQSVRPRILLLTQDFPPRVSVGAARWEGFAPFLDAAGWGIDVVMEDPADESSPDWDRFHRLPDDVRVATCERLRPKWYRMLRRARGAEPVTKADAAPVNTVGAGASGGLAATAREAMEILVKASQSSTLAREFAETALALFDGRQKIVASSGPNHYVHVAAAEVSRRHNIPHVIDLRDPWARLAPATTFERLLPDEQLRGMEAATLQRAALVITNTPAAADVLGQRFPQLRNRICSVPNGSDVEPILAPDVWPTVFQIAHTGALYLDRDPRPFMRAVARVRTSLGLNASQMRVVFMGEKAVINGQTLPELAQQAGIGDLFEERAAGTREEARQLMRDSVMAVAFQGATKTQVPAKVFEYVAFPVWVLALVSKDSATGDILANSDALVFDIDDENATARGIEECYLKFRAGVMPRPVGYDGRFSRKKQAERLIEQLKVLTK